MSYEKFVKNYNSYFRFQKDFKEYIKGKIKIPKFKKLEKICAVATLAGLLTMSLGASINSKPLFYAGLLTGNGAVGLGLYSFKKNNNWRKEQFEREAREYFADKSHINN
ncbi:MAG TPA: hypothetical protein VMC07_00650 [Candidatus Omnitrophota bacterium]|nr:hypothetical protein [Candidatus Omnitrophota bacterium]